VAPDSQRTDPRHPTAQEQSNIRPVAQCVLICLPGGRSLSKALAFGTARARKLVRWMFGARLVPRKADVPVLQFAGVKGRLRWLIDSRRPPGVARRI
jgi:hypothetical protein